MVAWWILRGQAWLVRFAVEA